MTPRLSRSLDLVRHLGARWVWRRVGDAVRRRTLVLKRRFSMPAFEDVQLRDGLDAVVPASSADYRAFHEGRPQRFFFPMGRLPDKGVMEAVVTTAGDVKDVWKPSRFAAAYWLVRAHALTGKEKYPAAFWELVESWCQQDPPNRGPNWKCGQETAMRSMAWCFALYGFWNAPATTAERIASLVKVLALQADRIVGYIGYAVSQKNNHALSEAVGLLTIAGMFPELKGSARWQRIARRVLEKEVCRPIYDDGSFVRHSMNYHRVMLDDCLWAIRLGELNGPSLSDELKARVGRAAEFLFQMLDMPSGGVPNYGANDGVLVLPLSSCDYWDYRPVIQAAGCLATGRRLLPDGPWNETLLWLFGAEALHSPAEGRLPTSQRFDIGGYYTLRAPKSWCMVRGHRYRDRSPHVDTLHVDLWYKGINVLGDGGTYRYYVPDQPWLERYFKDIQAHNTVVLDERGPLDLFSRFLWLPWPRAVCLEHRGDRWVGEHYAYRRPPWKVVHRRTVEWCGGADWRVTDELVGKGIHTFGWRWHLANGVCHLDEVGRSLEVELPPGRVRLQVAGPAGLRVSVERGASTCDRVSGWVSDYYGERTARPTLLASGSLALPAQLVTEILVEESGEA